MNALCLNQFLIKAETSRLVISLQMVPQVRYLIGRIYLGQLDIKETHLKNMLSPNLPAIAIKQMSHYLYLFLNLKHVLCLTC
jgi:hypothetical protein